MRLKRGQTIEARHGGRLPEWRYRSIYRAPEGGGEAGEDDFEREAHARLAAAGLPWCFGEMNHPHWRRVSITHLDERSASYYAGDDADAREAALSRLILCSRCPLIDRCHKVTTAKKAADPETTTTERRTNLLRAISRM